MKTSGIGVTAGIAAVALLTTALLAADGSVLERGRLIAQAKCARCHAVGAEGGSPVAAAPPFRMLPQRYPVENLAEALAEGIVVGHPMMPEFRFDPPEIDAILAYMEGLAPAQRRSKR